MVHFLLKLKRPSKASSRAVKIELRFWNEEGNQYSKFNLERIRNLLWNNENKGEGIIKLIEENRMGIPDFICKDKKTQEVFFVEVKANSAKLKKQQKETIKMLEEKGFKIDIRNVKVDFNVEELL